MKFSKLKRSDLKVGCVYWDYDMDFLRDDGTHLRGDFAIFRGFIKDSNKVELLDMERGRTDRIGDMLPTNGRHWVHLEKVYKIDINLKGGYDG